MAILGVKSLDSYCGRLLQQVTRLEWVGPLLLCDAEVSRLPWGVSGVYILHAFAARLGGYPAFYVGKSLDLRRRLAQHLGDRSAKASMRAMRELERTYFSASPAAAHILARVEAGLIRLLRPICNTQVPTAAPLVVTLPPMTLWD